MNVILVNDYGCYNMEYVKKNRTDPGLVEVIRQIISTFKEIEDYYEIYDLYRYSIAEIPDNVSDFKIVISPYIDCDGEVSGEKESLVYVLDGKMCESYKVFDRDGWHDETESD